MTFQSLELDFSYSNPLFAPFGDMAAPEGKSNLDLKLNVFPAAYANAFKAMFKALTGGELAEDATIFRLVFKPGKAAKLYGPALYRNEDKLVIRWGNELIELAIGKSTLKPVAEAAIDADLIQVNFTETKIGKYNESVAEIILEDFEGFSELTMPFPCKPADWQTGFDSKLAKGYSKKANGPELIEMFAQVNMGNGPAVSAGNTDGNVYGNDVLPQGVDLSIIGARACKTVHGPSFIITVKADAELGLEQDVQVWAFSKVRAKLAQGGTVSEEEPGTLNFAKYKNDKGETRYKINFKVNWPQSEDTLDFQAVLASWS